MDPFIKNICLSNEHFYMPGIVLKTMTNDEQWNECMLGDGTGRRDRWKAVWSSAEGRRQEKLRGETSNSSVLYSAQWQVSVTATMVH